MKEGTKESCDLELYLTSKEFKTLRQTDLKIIQTGEVDQATSKFRPWIKFYQEFKWLNSFAMTNECAL